MKDLHESFPYLRRDDAHLQWLVAQGRAVSDFRYKIRPFRHTKPNSGRNIIGMRKGFVWIGSHANYESRLARRWPIRFFFAYTAPLALGATVRWVKGKLFPKQNSTVAQFMKEVKRCFKTVPVDKTELQDKMAGMSNLLYQDIRVVERAFPLLAELQHLNKIIRPLEHKLVPRPGMGAKTIVDYPEARRIKELRAQRDSVYDAIHQAINILRSIDN